MQVLRRLNYFKMKKICFVIDKGLSPNSYIFYYILLNKNQIDHEMKFSLITLKKL